MPHALSPRQLKYLEFIREYIKKNENSPQLMEIANHFRVKSSTANKTLKALQKNGHLYFGRDKVTGYYIRVPERHTTSGVLKEIPITGIVDKFGEVSRFPKYLGHFPFMLPEDIGDVFALDVIQHIPSAGILGRDYMIFTIGGSAQPGDICIHLHGKRRLLVQMYEFGPNEEALFHKSALKWMYSKENYENHLFWWPLVLNEETGQDPEISEYFRSLDPDDPWMPIEPDAIIGKAVHLVRRLAI